MRVAAWMLLAALWPAVAAAATPAGLCRTAAIAAAERHGVPREILLAITRVETGRARGGAVEPWPWTLNIDGRGRWFDSRREALAAARAAIARRAGNVDLGCFQLNHRWHGSGFASLEAMIEPEAGADHAARFLSRLHAETGDWIRAAGYYHSRTRKHFERYRALILAALGAIRDGGEAAPRVARAPRPEPARARPPGPGAVRLGALTGARGGLLWARRRSGTDAD